MAFQPAAKSIPMIRELDNPERRISCMCTACAAQHSGSGSKMTSNASGTIEQKFAVGNAYTDALLEDLSWTGTTGQGRNITYGFETNPSSSGFFDSNSQTAARDALQAWSNVANITFTPQTANANITFGKSTFADPDQGGVAFTSFTGSTIQDVDIEISSRETTLQRGSFGYTIVLHEIGHALGLKHPGNYGAGDTAPFLPAIADNFRTSVMSYNEDVLVTYSNPPITPMLHDIAAIQFLYGANLTYQVGNSTYQLTGATIAQTLWDAGGVDMVSAASYSGGGGVRIDLGEGLDQFSRVGQTYSWAAFGANLENGEGSSGNDVVEGNALANTLFGRGGTDTVSGEDGNDTLTGGVGTFDPNDVGDELYGGRGNDVIYGNSGSDVVYGGRGVFDPEDGNDSIYGGKGADSVYGNSGNDTLYGGGSGVDPLDEADIMYGGKGADVLYGNGSGDTMYGGGNSFDPTDENDLMFGGAGNDSLFGNGSNDSIYGGEGNDTMHGGAGDDGYYFDFFSNGADAISSFEGAGVAGGDRVFIALNYGGITSAIDILARTTYDGTNASINLGGGNSIFIAGIGTVALTVDDVAVF
jgi:serralysin